MTTTALAGMSGVGTFETSIRSMLALPAVLTSNDRLVPPRAEAVGVPSNWIRVPLAGMPRIVTNCGLNGLYCRSTPGMYLMNSPMLPSAWSTNSSSAITFLMFGAFRCSVNATAWPVMARASTESGSRFTTLPSADADETFNSKSWFTVPPASTFTFATCGSMLRNRTSILVAPAGTWVSR